MTRVRSCMWLLLAVTLSEAATFERVYGTDADERGVAVAVIGDGGFVAVASSSRPDRPGAVLFIRADSAGEPITIRTVDLPLDVRAADMVIDVDLLPVVVGGARTSRGDWDCFAAKLTLDAETVWTRTWGDGLEDDEARAVAARDDGSLIVLGHVLARGQSDFALTCLSPDGSRRWSTTVGTGLPDIAAEVVVSPGGGLVAVGSTQTPGSRFTDVYVVWFDSAGRAYRSRSYGDSLWDEACGAAALPGGDVVLAGMSSGENGNETYLLRLDTLGQGRWQRKFGFGSSARARAVALVSNGDLLIAGERSAPGAAGPDLCLLRTSGEGTLFWDRSYGSSGADWGADIAATPDGGALVVGTSYQGSGRDYDVYVVRTDASGRIGIGTVEVGVARALDVWPVPATAGVWIAGDAIIENGVTLSSAEGQVVRRFASAGSGLLWWDACDDGGGRVRSGVYFVECGGRRQKLVVIGGR